MPRNYNDQAWPKELSEVKEVTEKENYGCETWQNHFLLFQCVDYSFFLTGFPLF